jgi:hypothetical protein
MPPALHTRPNHFRIGYRGSRINENIGVEADHQRSCISSRSNLCNVQPQGRPFAITSIAC